MSEEAADGGSEPSSQAFLRWMGMGADAAVAAGDTLLGPESSVEPPPVVVRSTSPALAREVWRLAWPAIAHMALITLVFLVGRVLVAHYSSTALASLQVSGTIVWSAYSICTAFAAGTLAVVARSIGAGDRARAGRAARASILFALFVGVAIVLPIRVANGALLRLLFPDASAAVLSDAAAYLHIVLPVLPLGLVEASAAAALQGSGDTKTPLAVAAAGNLVNVTLSALFIFGAFGLPVLGARGAAIGHAATMSIEGALLGIVVLRRFPRDQSSPLGRGLRRVLRVSWPTFLDKLVYHAGYFVFVAILGLLGDVAMAANQVLLGLEAICFLSAEGFGIAAGAVVAQKLGAAKPEDAKRSGQLAALMGVGLLTVLALSFLVAPRALVAAFSPDAGVITTGARALVVAAASQPFVAFATVLATSLRAAGDTRTVLGVTFVATFVVRIVATYVFAITLGMGLVGVWLGSTADWVVRSILLGFAYASGRWQRVAV